MNKKQPEGNERPNAERLRPYTDHYPNWDKPKFDPTKTYLTPKKDTPNKNVMSRVYEQVLDDFSAVRAEIYKRQLEMMGEPVEVDGNRG